MSLIDGRRIAAQINDETKARVAALGEAQLTPTLAVVVPTNDEATAWYVKSIVRAAKKLGIACEVEQLVDATRERIIERLKALSNEPGIHGIICQTPLPPGVALHEVSTHIAPSKDVDGANPTCLGRLAAGLPSFAPATAEAVVEILRREQVPLRGAKVVVVGRSTVVGKPAALLLVAEDATVTLCHSRTRELAEHCRSADVLVAAVGRPRLLGADHIKPGAVVIDVGTNPTDDGLVGDVDQAAVEAVAGALTPVPGGVGPVTTALLLRHVAEAAAAAAQL